MFSFLHFNFDAISFWLGFFAALLLTFGFSKIKRFFPEIGTSIKETFQQTQSHQKSGIQNYIMQNNLIKVQGLHIANQLFSLNEILIPSRLLAPTYQKPDDESFAITTLASHSLPYLPEASELAAQYNVLSLSPLEALQNGANIVIVGDAGSGKTTVLAQVASAIIQHPETAGNLADHLPYYIHIADIDFNGQDVNGPIGLFINPISKQHSSFARSRVPSAIIDAARKGKLLLLIDGLDELPKNQFIQAVNLLEALLDQSPRIQIMTTASPYYLGGLLKIGFQSMSIACWNIRDIELFIEQWNKQWLEYINNSVFSGNTSDSIDPRLIKNWLISQYVNMSPLQWTLKVWAAYSGDLNGPLPINAIDNYITRLSSKLVTREMLEYLALEFVRENSLTLSISHLENCVINYTPSRVTDLNDDASKIPVLPSRQGVSNEASVSSGNNPILGLIDAGLLIKHENQKVRFCNPLITGFLSSFAILEEQLDKVNQPLNWSVTTSMLRYMAAQDRGINWIDENILNQSDSPLYQNLMLVGKWISDAPVNLDWRTNFMRRVLGLIIIESVPFSIKARLMAIFVGSNDPSVSKLIKQFFATNSSSLKALAALASGAMQDNKQMRELSNLLTNPSQEVKNAAALAIGALATPYNIEALIDVLMQGDEQTRQGAAEALAFLPPRGHDILKEAILYDDIMVRKAAVYGLAQINEKWAVELLEKTGFDDKQWIVRNSAHQAAEFKTKKHPFSPRALPEPSDLPWLIEFAGKKGVGISKGEFPRDILLSCLNEGTLDEKIDTLSYLVRYPDYEVIYAIYKIMDTGDQNLSEAAINALWLISASGATLPDYKV
ncbi:MAG: HEAT repeat domain-containing protein [Anaerolineae bacterium]|nr:HEAT repeat domain-containing protein [Anaerolineae bacterium]